MAVHADDSSELSSALDNVRYTIGGITVPVEYAGPNGDGVPGLDQAKIALSSSMRFALLRPRSTLKSTTNRSAF